MNEAEVRLFDLNNAVEETLDRMSREWRYEYYEMSVIQVAAERRDRTIMAVAEVIAELAEKPLNKSDLATIIVDNSEFAFMGFDAVNTMPQTAFGRWFARWF
ncbi:MAG: hypothetical protein AAGK79_19790 [Pseudomonadota bacterium]